VAFVENTLKKSPELKKFINRYRPWYSENSNCVTLIVPNSLDALEQKLLPKAEAIFWVLYLVIPIVTGLLAYNWLPNESYNPAVHELIASHEVSDDEGRTRTVYDVWKDKKTGRIFRLENFEEHRRAESGRMAYTGFMYGLIGSAFFAFSQSRLRGKNCLCHSGRQRRLISLSPSILISALRRRTTEF
jgi:hypothetical protein